MFGGSAAAFQAGLLSLGFGVGAIAAGIGVGWAGANLVATESSLATIASNPLVQESLAVASAGLPYVSAVLGGSGDSWWTVGIAAASLSLAFAGGVSSAVNGAKARKALELRGETQPESSDARESLDRHLTSQIERIDERIGALEGENVQLTEEIATRREAIARDEAALDNPADGSMRRAIDNLLQGSIQPPGYREARIGRRIGVNEAFIRRAQVTITSNNTLIRRLTIRREEFITLRGILRR